MKIGIDIDGVVLDYERMMRFYAEYYDVLIHGNGKIDDDFDYLHNYEWNTYSKEEFINNYFILGTKQCSLVPGSKEIIDVLKKLGNEILFITARGSINKETKEVVKNVLEQFSIYYDQIYFETTDKVRLCKELGVDVMIDDNPNICNALKNASIKTIYFKDSDRQLQNNEFLYTMSNWGEILRYFIKS